jgi:multidrug efflux pump subunit AcrA (membrane-fusion protein)
MKHILSYLLLLFLAITLFESCNQKQESIHPTIEKITQSVFASGTVKSGNQYEVYAKVSGVIKKILVKEGEMVNKGQTIIQVSNTAPSLNYENAKLLENYSSDNANQEKLSQANNEVELAKSTAAAAQTTSSAENLGEYFKTRVASKYGEGFGKSPILLDYFTKLQTKD